MTERVQYNEKVAKFYYDVVMPQRMRHDFLYAMMHKYDDWYMEQMRCLACLILETMRVDPEDETNKIAICFREIICPQLHEHKNAKRFRPQDNVPPAGRQMTRGEQEAFHSWPEVATAVQAHMKCIGEWETGQGINNAIRRKDACDTILFSALVLTKPFFDWLFNSDERDIDDPQRDPDSPAVAHKQKLGVYVRDHLSHYLEGLMNGGIVNKSQVESFVNTARSGYLSYVGVWHPADRMEVYDPEPVIPGYNPT